MRIVWDEPKRIANLDKHGLDFADLTLEFFLDSMVVLARDGRAKAVGRLKDGHGRRDLRDAGQRGDLRHLDAAGKAR